MYIYIYIYIYDLLWCFIFLQKDEKYGCLFCSWRFQKSKCTQSCVILRMCIASSFRANILLDSATDSKTIHLVHNVASFVSKFRFPLPEVLVSKELCDCVLFTPQPQPQRYWCQAWICDRRRRLLSKRQLAHATAKRSIPSAPKTIFLQDEMSWAWYNKRHQQNFIVSWSMPDQPSNQREEQLRIQSSTPWFVIRCFTRSCKYC